MLKFVNLCSDLLMTRKVKETALSDAQPLLVSARCLAVKFLDVDDEWQVD